MKKIKDDRSLSVKKRNEKITKIIPLLVRSTGGYPANNATEIPESDYKIICDQMKDNTPTISKTPQPVNISRKQLAEQTFVSEKVIRDIEELVMDTSEIMGSEDNIIVTGVVNTDPRVSSFNNFRGEVSKVMHMQITGSDGKTFRVVIWNIDEERVPKVMNINAKIKLIGIRTKLGQYSDIELHGDEGTVIELMEKTNEIEVMSLRIISISRDTGKRQESFALAADKAKNIFTLVVDNMLIEQLKTNSIIECVPSRIYGTTLLLQDDAYIRITTEDQSFPNEISIERKIKDIKPSQELLFFEAVTLSAAKIQDIQVRDGTEVKYADIILGDDTAEIKLVGWREAANMIDSLGIGQRLKVYGVMAYTGRDNNTELRLKPFSSLIKL